MSKVLKIILICLAGSTILVLLGFVGSLRSSVLCEEILIENKTPSSDILVSDSTVKLAISAVENPVVGHPLNQIDTRFIESQVTALPYVKSSRAYKTIDKRVIIELHEREPIFRLIDNNGRTAFMDSEGYLLPKSNEAVLRLPVISGDFILPYDKLRTGVHYELIEDDSKVFSSIYTYAHAINSSEFWRAQLQFTEIDEQGNFSVYPQVGNHLIEFGTVDRIEEKLNNLRVFYQQGMDESRWNKYKNINLKYSDQVVCTKK